MTNAEMDKIKENYDKYYKERMRDKQFSDYIHSLGYGITGAHNMLFTFYLQGVKDAQEITARSDKLRRN